jgi:LysR family transcriptional regulator, nod-box dependent transcriptional activator
LLALSEKSLYRRLSIDLTDKRAGMRFDRLDLNLLVAFDVLGKEQNVSAAAKTLNLSQSAVSGALNRLREYFGDELLVPSGRRMILTPKAIQLIEPVREALLLIRTNITTPANFDPATTDRRFVLVASDYAYNVFLADALKAAGREAPGTCFDVLPPDVAAFERLESGEVDLLLTIESHLVRGHPRELLCEDEHAVVAWNQNPHCRDVLDADMFGRLGHATTFFGPERFPALSETLFEKMGIERKIDVRVSTFAAIPQCVIGTDRIATMHRRHAEYFARFLPIRIFDMPYDLPRVRESVQWHRIRQGDDGLQWMLNHIKAVCQLLP